jgi:hypothetical protein
VTSPILDSADAVVRAVRRRGYRSSREMAGALAREARDYPMGGPLWLELRARSRRFFGAWTRERARKDAA